MPTILAIGNSLYSVIKLKLFFLLQRVCPGCNGSLEIVRMKNLLGANTHRLLIIKTGIFIPLLVKIIYVPIRLCSPYDNRYVISQEFEIFPAHQQVFGS